LGNAIALFGSSRRHGNTGQLMNHIAERASIEIVDLSRRAAPSFTGMLTETFTYLGMRIGGIMHANCRDGYSRQSHEEAVAEFARGISA
jgi:hypothetical protein